ncbi:MAG: DEAD/DEAH box helicase [Candidatus Pacebacteria bacterium]|nr:DEAD/DEAH box helicase [Candidatus Paceibacterota bacterium]PIR60566.1 MAG: ATP-dependent helicase [Candidatus Pacebacteria bacterium CG10_big_fil_rev_8_21_14_0_10_44_54]
MYNSNRGRGFQNRANNNRGRNNFSGFGSGGNRGGRRQATFDPTPVIIQAGLQLQQLPEVEKKAFEPMHAFADFNISKQLKDNIAKRGYTTPTPIQDQIIPHILEGKDVVGIANTGTGKTAAFLIPLLEKVQNNQNEKVLIIVPTRELALQVRDELTSFAPGMQIYSSLCIGGAPIHRQIESLRRGQHFVIGTPGRIKDLNQRRKIRFEQFTNIVLDEVDRMLDMGFVKEIREIIQILPKQRQSLFFSATMTPRVREIMHGFLKNPVTVSVKTQDVAVQVRQEIVKLKGKSKVDVLHELLSTDGFAKVLVFGRTKHGAEKLKKELQYRGFKVDAIHGNKSQGQRQRALKAFKSSYIQALIATDVVSRGVDIKDVTHVINYDLPESYEDYIHRIGRTGRADKIGTALTFI